MVLSLVAMCKCGGVYIGRCAEEEEERWRVECCWDCSFAPSSFLPTVSGGVRTAKLAYLRPARHVVSSPMHTLTPCADNRMGSLRLTDTTGDLQETITLLLHVDRWEVGLFFAVAWGTHGRRASEGKTPLPYIEALLQTESPNKSPSVPAAEKAACAVGCRLAWQPSTRKSNPFFLRW